MLLFLTAATKLFFKSASESGCLPAAVWAGPLLNDEFGTWAEAMPPDPEFNVCAGPLAPGTGLGAFADPLSLGAAPDVWAAASLEARAALEAGADPEAAAVLKTGADPEATAAPWLGTAF